MTTFIGITLILLFSALIAVSLVKCVACVRKGRNY